MKITNLSRISEMAVNARRFDNRRNWTRCGETASSNLYLSSITSRRIKLSDQNFSKLLFGDQCRSLSAAYVAADNRLARAAALPAIETVAMFLVAVHALKQIKEHEPRRDVTKRLMTASRREAWLKFACDDHRAASRSREDPA